MDIAFRSQKPAAVEVQDLHVRLGGNPVLRGVNLRIEGLRRNLRTLESSLR